MSYWLTEKAFEDLKLMKTEADFDIQRMPQKEEAQYVARWLKLIHWSKRFIQGVDHIATHNTLKKPAKKIEWARDQYAAICDYYNKYFGGNGKCDVADHNLEYEAYVNVDNASWLLVYCLLYWETFTEVLPEHLIKDLYRKDMNPQVAWDKLHGQISRFIDLQDQTPDSLESFYTNHWESMVDTRMVQGHTLFSVSDYHCGAHPEMYYD